MQPNTVRVIAAVVDTHLLSLYKTNGEVMTLPQGDSRVRPILDTVVPLLLKQGYADITVDILTSRSEYAQFEETSSGAVKLFRIAKSKLLGLFGKKEEVSVEPVVPMAVGNIPAIADQTVAVTIDTQAHAVAEILKHAIPAQSPEFHEFGISQQGNIVETSGQTIKDHGKDDTSDTIIAVVDGQVIPGMEKIKTQFSRATKLGSTKGVEAFLKRIASIIHDRKHSVEDLLKFMERGDLPIADDGSILIYKVLRRNGEHFVDCHSEKVEQWVGAYVCMDPSLVDTNRSNECSNGLHVARRGYIREFSGDVCVLAKVAPEDVIAVPIYDANKMRVCGYHIIAELTQKQYSLVKQNKPITEDVDGRVLLGKAIAGQHIRKTHEVRITGHKGTGVQVKEIALLQQSKPKAKIAPVEALDNPGEEAKAEPVDPKDVVKQVEQLSRKEIAANLYADYQAKKPGALEALLTYKKTTKVSWEKLGIPASTDLVPVEAFVVKSAVITPQMVSDAADAIEEFGEDELERFRDEQEANKASKKTKAPDTKRVVDDVVLGEGSPKERIQKLLTIGLTSVGVAKAVLELKKKSKKSWTTLGVSDAQVDQITKLAQ